MRSNNSVPFLLGDIHFPAKGMLLGEEVLCSAMMSMLGNGDMMVSQQ